ncbi:MAG: hypothetical protein AAFU03_05485, partial [Bacteroidota bacterium]
MKKYTSSLLFLTICLCFIACECTELEPLLENNVLPTFIVEEHAVSFNFLLSAVGFDTISVGFLFSDSINQDQVILNENLFVTRDFISVDSVNYAFIASNILR